MTTQQPTERQGANAWNQATKELIESDLTESEWITLVERLGVQQGRLDRKRGMVKYLPNNKKK